MLTVTVTIRRADGPRRRRPPPRVTTTCGKLRRPPRTQVPSPIAPELKELAWGAGSFIVLFAAHAVLVLFPKLKKGMDARYGRASVGDHETADAERAAAKAEVAEYEARVGGRSRPRRASAVDAARQTLEAERTAPLAEVNAGIAARAPRPTPPRPRPRAPLPSSTSTRPSPTSPAAPASWPPAGAPTPTWSTESVGEVMAR